MSKEVRNTQLDTIVTTDPGKITDLADNVIYTPTATAKKLKAKFWARYTPGPNIGPDSITAVEVMDICKDTRAKGLWAQPGFRDWFLNRDENRERIEHLFGLALDAAESILTDESAHASAKVNMIKVIGELANKFPSRYQQERFTDDDINKMNEIQLKTWLEKRGIKMRPIKAIDAGDYHGEIINTTTDH